MLIKRLWKKFSKKRDQKIILKNNEHALTNSNLVKRKLAYIKPNRKLGLINSVGKVESSKKK